MLKEKVLEELDYEVNPDKHYAQIIIEISDSSKPFEEARRIIEANGVRIIEIRHLSTSRVLIKIDAMDMRGIVLHLIESGFSNIEGLNAGKLPY